MESRTHSPAPEAVAEMAKHLTWMAEHSAKGRIALIGTFPEALPSSFSTRMTAAPDCYEATSDLPRSGAQTLVVNGLGLDPDTLAHCAHGLSTGGSLIYTAPLCDPQTGTPLLPRAIIRAAETHFNVSECTISEGWFQLVAKKRDAADAPDPLTDNTVLALTEEAMAALSDPQNATGHPTPQQQSKQISDLQELVSRLSLQTARVGARVEGLAAQDGKSTGPQRLSPIQINGQPPAPEAKSAILTKEGVGYKLQLDGGQYYSLVVPILTGRPQTQNELIAIFRFTDKNGREISGPQTSLAHSEKVGSYIYLAPKTLSKDGSRIAFRAPTGTATLELKIALWNKPEGQAQISTDLTLQPLVLRMDNDAPAPEAYSPMVMDALREHAEIWPVGSVPTPNKAEQPFNLEAPIQFHLDVRQIDQLTLLPRLDGPVPISDKSGVLNATFFGADGTAMSYLDPKLGHSTAYGNFAYFPNTDKITIDIPRGCHSVTLDLHKWKISEQTSLRLPLEVQTACDTETGKLSPWRVAGYQVPEQVTPEDAPHMFAIVDEFTQFALSYDAKLTLPTPEDWEELLEAGDYDFVFVESAWKGNSAAWEFALTNPQHERHEALVAMLEAARAKGLKTVFWNKEDPPNFDAFIDTASLFDVVFTTDENCIPKYQARCGHDQIFALPFFAQPRIHNPIGKIERPEFSVAFAGTWYAERHLERQQAAKPLFDAAMTHGLTIFDRMSSWSKDDRFSFPLAYRAAVRPGVAYDEMLSLHKMFKLFLNINSVVDSPTMFSRRIFEVLASGTPVVSTPSVGVTQMFGELVPTPATPEQAAQCFETLLKNDLDRKRLGHQGYREVMRNHTARQRLSEIWGKLGHELPAQKDPMVTWAVPTNRPEHLKYIVENFQRQTYENIELIVALNSDRFNKAEVEAAFGGDPRVRVIQLPEEKTLGEVLNATIDLMNGDYWMKIDDDNVYLERFTEDLMLPFRYTDARIIGKQSYFAYLEASDQTILRQVGADHRFVPLCSGSALAVDRQIFEWNRFPEQSLGEDTVWLKKALDGGEKIYSPDIFNYAVVRRANKGSHTWQAEDAELMKGAIRIGDGLMLDAIRG